MKKIFLSAILSSYMLANNVGVSILPQVEIVKKLLPNAKITTLMPAGADPHTYEPKPKQMLELSHAKVFLSIGVEVEEVWLKRLAENTNIKIVKTDAGVKKMNYSQIELEDYHGYGDDALAKHECPHMHGGEHVHGDKHECEHHHGEHHHHEHSHNHHDHDHHDHDHDHHHAHEHHHHHDHSGQDVHIWTDPLILKQIASNSAKALKEAFPSEAAKIEQNLQKYQKELDELNLKIYDLSKNVKIKGFITSHPAWGYFAKRYELAEYTLELDGKDIKPKDLAKIIELAKDKKACLILKAPQFDDKLAKSIHKESKVKLVSIDPLSQDISKELLNFAKILSDNCSKH